MPGFYNEGRQVCHAVLSCSCKENKGPVDDLVRISIIVHKNFILSQSHITIIDEPWY